MKKSKNFVLVILALILICVPIVSNAEPAPPLTQIGFTNLSFDENMQLCVEVKEIGTSSSRFVCANNILCDEIVNEKVVLWDDHNHAYGYKRYYKLKGVYAIIKLDGTLTTNHPGQSYMIKARFHNAMAPWDEKTASMHITLRSEIKMRISNNYNMCNSYKNDEKRCNNKFNEVLDKTLDKTKLNRNEVGDNRKFSGRWILITEGINRGKVISIKYADDSTPEDPIMCTTTGERVKINDVNPNEATELEMRIYCAHLDSIGKGTGGTFGTYNDLSTVKATAHVNNFNPYGTLTVTEKSMKNLKINWPDLTKKVMNIVKSNDQKLYLRLVKLHEEIQ